jgi:hypothetical protein
MNSRKKNLSEIADKMASLKKSISEGGSGGFDFPEGGESGDILTKASNADGDVEWSPQAGESLVGNSRETEALNGQGNFVFGNACIGNPYRNALANGGFNAGVNLVTSPTAGKWEFFNGGNAGNTAAILSSANETGFGNTNKVQITQGGTGSPFLQQVLRTIFSAIYFGRTVHLSFYARLVSGPNLTLLPIFRRYQGINVNDFQPIGGSQVLSSSNWTKFSFSFDVSVLSNRPSASMFFVLDAATRVTEYTDFQLELDQETPFNRLSPFTEIFFGA